MEMLTWISFFQGNRCTKVLYLTLLSCRRRRAKGRYGKRCRNNSRSSRKDKGSMTKGSKLLLNIQNTCKTCEMFKTENKMKHSGMIQRHTGRVTWQSHRQCLLRFLYISTRTTYLNSINALYPSSHHNSIPRTIEIRIFSYFSSPSKFSRNLWRNLRRNLLNPM